MSFNISFLTKDIIAGLEFMDFQNNNFFIALSGYLKDRIDQSGRIEDLDEGLNAIIEEYTGFSKIDINLENFGNLAIDAGYISPSNLFNIEGIEYYLPRSETSLYRWFKDNKTQFFQGDIDYRTGKVSGDYKTIPFKMYVNANTKDYLDLKMLEKYNYGVHEAIAGFITHELGHAFGGVSMVHQSVSDNFHVRSAIHFLSGASYSKDRVTIIKDFSRLTETKIDNLSELEKLAEKNDPNTYVIYLTKLIAGRDLNNAAGLGVKEINSEVIADAYAVRMGCDKAMLAGMNAMHMKMESSYNVMSIALAIMPAAYLLGSGLTLSGGIFFALGLYGLMRIMGAIGNTQTSSYNTPYRRAMNVLQEQIQRIKQAPKLTSKEKEVLIANVNEGLRFAQEMKPMLEGTAVQRFFGWLSTAGKFKYTDLEYYTQNINSHSSSLLGDEFRNLKGSV